MGGGFNGAASRRGWALAVGAAVALGGDVAARQPDLGPVLGLVGAATHSDRWFGWLARTFVPAGAVVEPWAGPAQTVSADPLDRGGRLQVGPDAGQSAPSATSRGLDLLIGADRLDDLEVDLELGLGARGAHDDP